MSKQTKSSSIRPDESKENMRWIRDSIERCKKDLEERKKLTEEVHRRLEAVVGPFPRVGE
jgi:TPP-dependent pyruvate/acetoin dehydrogenase alpha subunit